MKTVKITLIVFVCIALLFTAVGYVMTCYALQPSNISQYDAESDAYIDQYPNALNWKDSLVKNGQLKDTFITNNEGIKLHALLLAADSAKGTTILVHGYTDCALRMIPLGKMHYENGFNILLPDLQYHGKSEGDAIQMGWKDRLDVMQWIEVAHERFRDSFTVLHGVSMGGATVMMVSGEELPTYVKAVVEDCGYSSVKEQFKKELSEQFRLPEHPILDFASWITQIRFGWNFKEASAIKQISKTTLPVLFIHGDSDGYVQTSMVYELYEAKKNGIKDSMITKNTIHAESFLNHPEEYTKKVKEFLSKIK